jgi:hypothetical protein
LEPLLRQRSLTHEKPQVPAGRDGVTDCGGGRPDQPLHRQHLGRRNHVIVARHQQIDRQLDARQTDPSAEGRESPGCKLVFQIEPLNHF